MSTQPAPAAPRRQFVPCPVCHGDMWVETHIDGSGIGHGYPCRRCDHGYIEVPVREPAQ